MRMLRGLLIALLTGFAGCILAIFVGDYLTKLAHVPEMEGQRGMTVFFLCVPLGIIAGLVVGITVAILVRRQGLAGFVVAQVRRCWFFVVLPVWSVACRICCPINLQNSTANASTWNSSFAHQRRSKFRSSPTATVSESAFTRIIGKAVSLLSIGIRSQKMPSTLSFPVKFRCSRTARLARCSPRSVTSRSRRNLLS